MKVWILTEERNVSAMSAEGPNGWVAGVYATKELADAAREAAIVASVTGKDEDAGRPMLMWQQTRCATCGTDLDRQSNWLAEVNNVSCPTCGEQHTINRSECDEWDVDFEIREFEVEGAPLVDQSVADFFGAFGHPQPVVPVNVTCSRCGNYGHGQDDCPERGQS